MKVRALKEDDIHFIKRLHEKYYSHFAFPDFMNLLCGFVITDENDKFILAGGVEQIAETVLVTDQENNIVTIGRALLEAQRISMFTCMKYGINELHAFTNDEDYIKHLIQHGFQPRSRAFSMKV